MNNQNDKKMMNTEFQKAVSDMVEHTAMHGLPNLTNRKEVHKKVFWILVLLAALGFLIWQIQELIVKYYQYPTSTTTDLVFASELNFPAVTFCNLNPVRRSYIPRLPPYMQDTMNTNTMGRPPRPGGHNDTKNDYNSERNDTSTCDKFYNQFALLKPAIKQESGHQIEDMLLDCSWDFFTCGPDNFTQFNNWKYGNCFTFNSGINETIEKTRQPGPKRGLTLRLYVQKYEYVPVISTSVGIKMVIHNQSSMPFPESDGFLVSTGTWTQVSIKTTYISREDPPHGKCSNFSKEAAALLTAYPEVLASSEYTRQGCMNTCKQKQIMKKYKCGSSQYPINGTAFDDIDSEWKKFCDWSNETLQDEIDEEDYKANVYCSNYVLCPDRCVDLSYPVTISHSYWPTEEQEEKTYSDLNSLAMDTNDTRLLQLQAPSTTSNKKAEFIPQNVMVVEVFLEDLSYLSYVTSEAFGIEAFLASLGGTLGLWLGMSVVTICELIQFIIDVCGIFVKCGQNKVERSDSNEKPTEMSAAGENDGYSFHNAPSLFDTSQRVLNNK